MQLKLKRSQRSGGMLGGKVIFILDARAEMAPNEVDLVKKYNLGKTNVYDSTERKKHQANAVERFEGTAGHPATGKGVAKVLWGSARGIASAAMMALSLNITIDGLSAGQHIECKDLNELLGAEEAIKEACQNTMAYLDIAQSFDGREEVLEF